MTEGELVVAERLVCRFRVAKGLRRAQLVEAVRNVDLTVRQGEILAVVGESGSGKSTLGRALVRLLQPTSGRVLFRGDDVARLKGAELMRFRSRAQIIFQNPYQTLNPRLSVGDALDEVVALWRRRGAITGRVSAQDLLATVHLPGDYVSKRPHELSGGQRQRVAIARAMAVQPEFIVADEPVSSLDVSAAARVLNLLLELREETDFTCVFITHDLGLARVFADRIAVMRLGEVVDVGPADTLFDQPGHAYTEQLIAAQPPPPGAASGARSRGA